MSPQRIQRKRTKGWRMPEGAVYVGRPTKWGNPAIIEHTRLPVHPDHYTVHPDGRLEITEEDWQGIVRANRRWISLPVWKVWGDDVSAAGCYLTKAAAHQAAVEIFRTQHIRHLPDPSELTGRDLACWCPTEYACHADVLLELANGGTP